MSRGGNQTKVLRVLPGCCRSLSEIAEATGMSHHAISMAAGSLIKKGLVERKEIGCYQLTPEGVEAVEAGVEITSGPNAPIEHARAAVRSSCRQRAWAAMRMHRAFTISDLIVAAGRGNERDPTNNLQRYCSALCRAGILRKMRRRVSGTHPSSNGYLRYQLLQDLGPIAPSVRQKIDAVHDHNCGEDIAYVC